MPHSLKNKIKSLCYKGEITENERDRLIHALEQQPCEDCISRSKAIEMLGDEPENWTDTEKEIQEVNDYRWFKSILESLPSVTPQQTCEEENLSRFCDDFCRYPREYDEEKEGEYMTEKVCSTCPLGRL